MIQQLAIHKLNFPIFLLWGEGQTVKCSLQNSFVGSQASWKCSWETKTFLCPHSPNSIFVELFCCSGSLNFRLFLLFLSCFIIIHNYTILLCYVFYYVMYFLWDRKKMCQLVLALLTSMAFGHTLCSGFSFLSRVPYFHVVQFFISSGHPLYFYISFLFVLQVIHF